MWSKITTNHRLLIGITFVIFFTIFSHVKTATAESNENICGTDICILAPDNITFTLGSNTNEATVDPLVLENTSSNSVNITNISTEIIDPTYSFESYSTDFSAFDADAKKLALAIKNTDSTISDISGSNGIEFNEIIPAGNTSKYNLKGKSSAFTESVENATVAKIVFTFSATEDSPKTTGCNSNELEKWNYKKNDTAKKITLEALKKDSTDKTVVICDSYIINGETYSTELGENFEIYPDNYEEMIAVHFGDNVDSSLVTDMSGMFSCLTSLENITLPYNFGINATNMDYMFEATNLKTLDLTRLNTSKVQSMEFMFSENSNLETIIFPENFGISATKMTQMFAYDTALKTLDLTKFSMSNVKNTILMFRDATALETVYVDDSWTTNNITSGDNMFYRAYSLVGGAGTTVTNITDKTYARIDNGYNGEPGYFTDKKYKIHLNPNGGNLTFAEEKQDIKSVEYSELQDGGYNFNLNDFTASKYIPTREGYTFLGWDENQNATTPTYAYNSANNTFSTSTVNVDSFNTKVLYAIWQDLPKVAKAILTDDGNLNFIYDNKTYTEGEEYSYTVDDINYVTSEIKNIYATEYHRWNGNINNGRSDITSANFDQSFKEFYPTSTAYWFQFDKYLSTITNINNLNTNNVTNMSFMFYRTGYDATTWNIGNLDSWNVSSVTNMSNMFADAGYSAKTWNIGDLSNWNVGSVTDMSSMFGSAGRKKATTWNIGNLGNWNVSSVTNMSYMFSHAGYSATTWNIGDLGDWNVSNVTSMSEMFSYAGRSATTFNIGNLDNWNVSNVTNMSSMFSHAGYSAKTWNIGNLDSWNVSSVTNMSSMFFSAGYSAKTWNIGDLSNWNVSSVTNMSSMFDLAGRSATTWNIGNLDNWNVGSVTDISYMFDSAGRSATTWNIGNLDNWNVGSVTDISYMFDSAGDSAKTWNIGDLSNWNVGSVTDMSSMFDSAGYSATTWNIGDLGNWNVGNVTNMSRMFHYAGCSAADTWSIGDLGDWNVSSVRNMNSMFSAAGYSANTWSIGDLGDWNVSSVRNMNSMFSAAGYSADTWSIGDLGKWNVSNVTDISAMFDSAGYSSTTWDIGNLSTKVISATDSPTGESYTAWDVSSISTFGTGSSGFNFHCGNSDSSGSDLCYKTFGNIGKNVPGGITLDLSGWTPSSATDMRNMFSDSNIKTIYSDNDWATIATNIGSNSTNMFYNNTNLVGGNSTAYSSSNANDISYAHPDGGVSNPGYFTYKCSMNCSAKAILTDDGNLNFIYDNKTYTEGEEYSYTVDKINYNTSEIKNIYAVPENSSSSAQIGWAGKNSDYREDITTANFDSSFQEFYPTSTAYWFYYDAYISSITNIDNLNTDNVTDMQSMFYVTSQHSDSDFSYDFSGWNVSQVTNMNAMFAGTGGEEYTEFHLDLHNWDVSNVTSMADMFNFAGYESTRFHLDLHDWDTAQLQNIESMFEAAGHNTREDYYLNVSGWDTHNITNMLATFYGVGWQSSSFTLDLSSWDVSNVINMSYTFAVAGYQATSFQIDLSGWNTHNVTDMSYMFSHSGVSTIYVNELWSTDSLTQLGAQEIFQECNNLIGGQGTQFSETYHTDSSYARIDQGPDSDAPGYFTYKGNCNENCTAKAILTADGNLNFIYDQNTYAENDSYSYSIDGTNTITSTITAVYDVPENSTSANKPGWTGTSSNGRSDITSANFDSSFKDFSPTSTAYWFYEDRYLSTITNVENLNTSSVTNMSYMFYKASSLTSLTLPAGFGQSATGSMSSMFDGASSLTSLTLPEGFGSQATNMRFMFSDASSLTSLTLPSGFGQSATDMSNMFNKASLTSLTLPAGFGSEAKDMNNMFLRASALTSLDLPVGFGSQATSMSHMFYRASSLTSLTLPSGFGQKATKMNSMFSDASSLTSLNLPAGFGSEATDMSSMFDGASHLTSLTLPSGFGQKATKMNSMFSGASSLGHIYVPAGTNWETKTPAVTSSTDMFYRASKLPNYNNSHTDISAAHIGNVNGVMGYFTDKSSYHENYTAKAILTADGNLNFIYDQNTYAENDSYSYSIDGTNTITSTITAVYDVPENSTSANKPGWTGTSSNGRSDITSANFDSSFKDFSPTSTAYWFYEDRYLSTITNVENLNTSSVTNMSYMFRSASALTSLDLPAGFGSEATDMSYMFRSATSLQTVILPESFGEKATKMSYIFNGDSNLENIYVPAGTNWETKSVTVSGQTQMFTGATKLPNYDENTVTITVAHIGNVNGVMGYFTDKSSYHENYTAKAILTADGNLNFIYDQNTYAENDSYSYSIDGTNTITSTITAVYDVPENSTSANKPGWTGTSSNGRSDITSANFDSSFNDFSPTSTAYWFYEDHYLSTITNVENLNTSSVTNMSYMFYNASLTSLTLPAGFGQSATDMNHMFSYASSLTSLTLPSGSGQSATDMHWMFYGASSLQSLTLPAGFGQSATDMNHMFSYASSLTSLTLPEGFGSEATDMSDMFRSASSLTSLTLPSGFGQSATDMEYMFYKASSLTSVEFSSGFGQSATDMNNMFYEASSLTSLTLPSGFGQSATNMRSMFYGASYLQSLTLPSGFGQSATDMHWMFRYASSLKNIYVPAGTNWATKTPAVTSSDSMFLGASKLPNYNNSRTDVAAAYIGDVNGTMGYFTDVCVLYNTCLIAPESPVSSPSSSPALSSIYGVQKMDGMTEQTEYSENGEPEEENTEPLGVKEESGLKIWIIIPIFFFLIIILPLIIIFIRKKKKEDEQYIEEF